MRGFGIYSPHSAVPKCEGFLYLYHRPCLNLRPALPTHPSDARTDDGFLFTIPSRPECPPPYINHHHNQQTRHVALIDVTFILVHQASSKKCPTAEQAKPLVHPALPLQRHDDTGSGRGIATPRHRESQHRGAKFGIVMTTAATNQQRWGPKPKVGGSKRAAAARLLRHTPPNINISASRELRWWTAGV